MSALQQRTAVAYIPTVGQAGLLACPSDGCGSQRSNEVTCCRRKVLEACTQGIKLTRLC